MDNKLLDNLDSDKMYNEIFKIDNIKAEQYIAYLKSIIYINNEITNNLIITINNIFDQSTLNYDTNFLINFTNISKLITHNFNNYYFEMTSIDNRENDSRNNDYILIISVFCFKYIIKILALDDNKQKYILAETNCSEFIRDNIIFKNICPHFVTYINKLCIGNNIGKIKLKYKNNIAIIYHYISAWTVNINNNIIRIGNLDELFQNFSLYKNYFKLEYINIILYNILFQIIYSICALSKFRINHNDLKTNNILLHGNYNTNTYDLYKIQSNNEIINFYLPNLGFKVKIIDFGLTHSDKYNKLSNPISKKHELINEAGLFTYYSDYYDLHLIINYIFTGYLLENIYIEIKKFLCQIINSKYLGKTNNNKFINKYWRLAFPYTLKEYINYIKSDNVSETDKITDKITDNVLETNNILEPDNILETDQILESDKITDNVLETDNILESDKIIDNVLETDKILKTNNILDTKTNIISKLNYDLIYDINHNLIISNELKKNLLKYMMHISKSDKIDYHILNMIIDPLDNNINHIMKPLEAIKLFKMFLIKQDDIIICNTYELIL